MLANGNQNIFVSCYAVRKVIIYALHMTRIRIRIRMTDFIDPMKEAFDNMQHPMELMLLNRACIPYVAM